MKPTHRRAGHTARTGSRPAAGQRPLSMILPGTHPNDHLNRAASDAVVHVSPGTGYDPVPIDLDTITTLIYLTGMDPAAWERVGPERVAEFVLRSCENPALRVRELVALLACAHDNHHVLTDYYDQVRAFAPAVLAVFTHATPGD
ncbi:hypothetical protein [Actinosynnema sp. NPDC023587]|uniref:hypothetical protein n=1 Tax=Actinosynnema sp. NPDC023587 TaxID=3154695 RepID=UPI0033E88CC6